MNTIPESIKQLQQLLQEIADWFEQYPSNQTLYPMSYRGITEALRIMNLDREVVVWN